METDTNGLAQKSSNSNAYNKVVRVKKKKFGVLESKKETICT